MVAPAITFHDLEEIAVGPSSFSAHVTAARKSSAVVRGA